MRFKPFGIAMLASLLAVAMLAASASAQGVSDATKTLDDALKSKNADAVSSGISALISAYIDAEKEADKTAAVNSLAKTLKFYGGDGKCIIEAAQGLSGMGAPAAKPLASALKDKKLRKEPKLKEAYLACIRALGATKSVRDSKTLINLLKDKDFYVVAAAADALGNYNDVKLNYRRSIAEQMVNALDSAYNAAQADPRNTTFQKRYEIIGVPLMTALSKVTGASPGGAPEWRKWFNDNKKKRWN